MKFVCKGLDLSDALLRVSKACASKTTISILECIKISAVNDGITLFASDGELSIQKSVKAEVLEEGEICVHGKTFTDFINKLINEDVAIRTSDKGLEISYDDNASYLQVLPASDFPTVDTDIQKDNFVLDAKTFKNLVSKSVFCCAQDDSRPILKGCLLQIDQNDLTITALDGFRMAVLKEKIISGSGTMKVVCPARTLNEIARMISDDAEEITIFVENGSMMVKLDDTVIISRLYQGEFIDYKRIMPPEFSTVIKVNKTELAESVERAGIVIRGDKNNLVVFDVKGNVVVITSNSEMGNVSEKVKCEMNGEELKIAMNAKYVLDAVKALDGEEVTVQFNNAVSPFIIQDEKSGEDFYLILPVRMGN